MYLQNIIASAISTGGSSGQMPIRRSQEKLLMILEQNPRIGGAVDLGQFEKLKDLKARGQGSPVGEATVFEVN